MLLTRLTGLRRIGRFRGPGLFRRFGSLGHDRRRGRFLGNRRVRDRSRQRQREGAGADEDAAEQAAARGDVGHRETPQAMDDGFVAEHRAGHRRSQRKARTGGNIDDQRGIERALVAASAGEHAGVARRFLVAAHRAPAHPRQWVEPVQREQRLRREVGEQVVPFVVGNLVRNRQVARRDVRLGHEQQRQTDYLVMHAKRDRLLQGRRLDQPDIADLANRAGAGEQFAAHPAIARDAPGEESEHAAGPHRKRDFAENRPIECGCCRFDGHEVDGLHRHDRGRFHHVQRRGNRRRFGRVLEARRQHDRRQQQPQERQGPQRIGILRPEIAPDGAAQHQHHADQQAAVEDGVDQPGGHLRNSPKRRSISAMSSSDRASVSAR